MSRAWPDVQLSRVLPRIALCYFFAASLYVCLSRSGIGWLLVSQRWTDRQKVAWLLTAGTVAIAVGLLWNIQFPIIKRIWTSSYCIIAGGFSAIALGLYFLVIDVLHWRKWCAPCLWIRANSLVIYLVVNLVDFESIAERFVGGDVQTLLESNVSKGAGGIILAVVALLLPLLLVRFMYRRKIFIRL